ncbi:hypothetical protein AGLY_011318 [Aphis glycines]|uniref:Uncharacterized protein n=1 Tax=Aphis glycines TaxID=307491 RepID=A0A6G0TD39_APHGL|nr:hypothetical protein AGLY_011318 [Aphis glycines]
MKTSRENENEQCLVIYPVYRVEYEQNSERSDECIDFTIIITSRNNASISNFRGGFRWQSEYSWCIIEVKSKHFPTIFKKIEKNKKKVMEKREFSTKSIFFMVTTEIFDFSENCFFEVSILVESNIVKIKNATLSFPQLFLQVAIDKTQSIIIGKILSILESFTSYLDLHFLYIILFSKYFAYFNAIYIVQILTKICQNYEDMQIILNRPRLTNHLRS